MKYGGQSKRGWWRKICRSRKRRQPKRAYSTDKPYVSRRSSSWSWRVPINWHHMTNRCKRGKGRTGSSRNKLRIKVPRHDSLHYYFGNLRWEVIGDVIYYGAVVKRRKFLGLSDLQIGDALFSIFHKRDPMVCVQVIDRISLAKGRVTRMLFRTAEAA
jgi:hypothetical protein